MRHINTWFDQLCRLTAVDGRMAPFCSTTSRAAPLTSKADQEVLFVAALQAADDDHGESSSGDGGLPSTAHQRQRPVHIKAPSFSIRICR